MYYRLRSPQNTFLLCVILGQTHVVGSCKSVGADPEAVEREAEHGHGVDTDTDIVPFPELLVDALEVFGYLERTKVREGKGRGEQRPLRRVNHIAFPPSLRGPSVS